MLSMMLLLLIWGVSKPWSRSFVICVVVVVVVVCVRYLVSLFFHSSATTNFKNRYVVMYPSTEDIDSESIHTH